MWLEFNFFITMKEKNYIFVCSEFLTKDKRKIIKNYYYKIIYIYIYLFCVITYFSFHYKVV